MTIHSTLIQDVSEQYAPPESNLLEISVIGNVVCISIVRCEDETDKTSTYETLASVSVYLDSLAAAMNASVSANYLRTE